MKDCTAERYDLRSCQADIKSSNSHFLNFETPQGRFNKLFPQGSRGVGTVRRESRRTAWLRAEDVRRDSLRTPIPRPHTPPFPTNAPAEGAPKSL